MAKQHVKRSTKATLKAPNGLKTGPNKPPSAIPFPYITSSSALSPFLDDLDPAHVYLLHIDTHPPSKKRQIYLIAAAMNILIGLLLLWRASIALPKYLKISLAALGYDNEEKVDIAALDMGSLMEVGMRRTFTFLIDYALFVYLFPWPKDFFVGKPASPTSWRLTVKFEPQEIVVRKSRRWEKSLPKDWLEASNTDSPVYADKIMPAIQREWIAKKTGYLMMDKNWDLDYPAMLAAHALVSSGEAALDDFQKTVAVYSEAREQWLIWPVHEVDGGGQEEGRRKIQVFKDKLTAMGKENLFFKWIELIQYESSQLGGLTEKRRESVRRKAKEMFEGQEVDFERFWDNVGGAEGMPGLEESGL